MSTFGQGLAWFAVVALIFSGILWAILRAKARTYTDEVVRELTKYVKPDQAGAPTPLVAPSRYPSDSPSILAEKEQQWKIITQHPLPLEKHIEMLVHWLAVAKVSMRFQDIYFTLFGSQHRFLQQLNLQKVTLGATNRANAQEFLRLQAESDPIAKTHNLDRWLQYLVQVEFITINIDMISLTPIGQDFLVWVLRNQLPTRSYEGV